MRAFLFASISLASVLSPAQPNARWTLLPEAGSEAQNILAATSDPAGNVYVVVKTNPNSPNPTEKLVKISPLGIVVWSRGLTLSASEVNWSNTRVVSADKLGNIALAGRASLGGLTHGFMQKLDANGDAVFTKLFMDDASRTYYPRDVQFDHTNQVAMTGYLTFNGQPRMMLHRYGLAGQLRFIRYYLNVNYSETTGEFVRFDPSGNLYVGGSSYFTRLQPFFWSFTPSGAPRYARSLVLAPALAATDGGVLPDGSFYASLGSLVNATKTMGIIRMTPSGGTAWYRLKTFATGNLFTTRFGLARNGNAIVVGSHSTTGNADDSWRLFMLSPTGTTLSDRVMGGANASSPDYIYGVTSDAANNFYLAGTAQWGIQSAGRLQQVLPTGANGWATSTAANVSWYPQGMFQDSNGNFIVHGFRWTADGPMGMVSRLGNLVSMTAPSATVAAGSNLTVTVRLASAGRIGGTPVALSSSSARLLVPASVSVPVGQTSVTFVARATAGAGASATIMARLGGTTKTLPVTITGG